MRALMIGLWCLSLGVSACTPSAPLRNCTTLVAYSRQDDNALLAELSTLPKDRYPQVRRYLKDWGAARASMRRCPKG